METLDVRLCDFDEIFRDLSYYWLQDKEVNYFTNAGEQTKESQLKWYESIKRRKDYLIWGVMYENKRIGVCGIKNINGNIGEYFGYIGDKSLWGKGLGKMMMKKLETILYSSHSYIHTIFLKVLKDNKRAISLYCKLGYIEVGEEGKFLLMSKKID